MHKVAYLFPGQGSQSVGMGRDFFENSDIARNVYETFNRIVSPDLSKVCFEGPEEELKRTLYTQPAILATSIAALELFRDKLSLTPALAAGHSLGEYGALYAAGVIDLETAARLVRKRSELMESAPTGAMSAVLGLAENNVDKIIAQLKGEGHIITVANYNTGDQYVISGSPEAITEAAERLKAEGAKRVLPLPVGGAFHSPLMDNAASEFKTFLQDFTFNDAGFPVIANVDAAPTQQGSALQEKLSDQINSSVRWLHTMTHMFAEAGAGTVIEFGPGKVLTGMVKKSYPDIQVFNVFDIASLEKTLAEVQPQMELV